MELEAKVGFCLVVKPRATYASVPECKINYYKKYNLGGGR